MAGLGPLWENFIANCAIHGLVRVFQPIGSPPTTVSRNFRVIWLVIWLSSAALMIYQMSEVFSRYARDEKVVSISSVEGDPVEIPAVAVCLLHKSDKQSDVTIDSDSSSIPLGQDVTVDTILGEGPFLVGNQIFNRSHFKKLWDIRFKLRQYGTDMDCFSFGNSRSQNGFPKLKTGNSVLALVLKKKNLTDGFVVMLHAPMMVPWQALRPTLRSLEDQQIRDMFAISFKEEKFVRDGNCITNWNEMQIFGPLLQCYPDLVKFAYSKEACTIFNEVKMGNEMADMQLIPKNDNCNYPSEGFKLLQCPRQCQKTLYDVKQVDINQMQQEESPMEFSLFIKNEELSSKNIIELPAMTFEQLVGNVGGVLGLWLGASFLTLVEVIEFFTNVFINAYSKIVKKRSAVNTGAIHQSTNDDTGMTIVHY